MSLLYRVREAIQSNTINNKNHDGDTLLHISCCANNMDAVKILLTHNASILHDWYGNTPLHIAILYTRDTIVKLLLTYDAGQALKTNSSDQIPLMLHMVNWTILKS